MVFAQDYKSLLAAHIEAGNDITLLYHKVNNADTNYMNCEFLELDDEKSVKSIQTNIGGKKSKNIFMNSYIMKKNLFIDLVNEAKKKSSRKNNSTVEAAPESKEQNLITEIVTRAKRLQKDIVEELAYYGVQITEVAV